MAGNKNEDMEQISKMAFNYQIPSYFSNTEEIK